MTSQDMHAQFHTNAELRQALQQTRGVTQQVRHIISKSILQQKAIKSRCTAFDLRIEVLLDEVQQLKAEE